jgi:PAS domain S-box-containing protein
VEITRVTAGDRSWNPGDPRWLPHNRNVLTFDYRAISFVDENQVRVRSWLEGLEPGWQVPQRPHQWNIHYNFLPPGRYRLHLQAANADDQWSEVASSEFIHIRFPFWHTGWFYSLVLFTVATVGFFSHRFVNQRRYLRLLRKEVISRVAELQQSESRFGVTLDSIADGVLTTGLKGDVLYMNPAAELIFGPSSENISSPVLRDLFRLPGISEKELNELIKHVFTGTVWTSRLKLERPDQDVQLIEVGTAALRDSDQQLLGAVIVVRDVTEKVRLQEELDQSQKLASLGTLAGGIAHDFNNLLAVIKWNVSALQQDANQTTQKHAIELIDNAVDQATTLSEQMLTFARGGIPLLQTCFLDTLIRSSIALHANESNLQFKVDLADDLWPVEVDTVQFNQVLNNLLTNASQAMPAGGTISVRAANRQLANNDGAGREVEIEIQDQGEGIPPDKLQRVFEPYFTTKSKGFGIGLATCYSIIKKHHGKLTVVSEVGQGSTFRIRLPASTNTPKAPEQNSQLEDNVSNRILVVDDDDLVRKSLTAVLKTAEFQVVAVSNGSEAITTYQQDQALGGHFHAVLIDLTMPGGLDGCETIKRLLKIDPDVRGIVISGYSDEQVLANYEQYGFVDRLQKPSSLEELQNVLNRLPVNQN